MNIAFVLILNPETILKLDLKTIPNYVFCFTEIEFNEKDNLILSVYPDFKNRIFFIPKEKSDKDNILKAVLSKLYHENFTHVILSLHPSVSLFSCFSILHNRVKEFFSRQDTYLFGIYAEPDIIGIHCMNFYQYISSDIARLSYEIARRCDILYDVSPYITRKSHLFSATKMYKKKIVKRVNALSTKHNFSVVTTIDVVFNDSTKKKKIENILSKLHMCNIHMIKLPKSRDDLPFLLTGDFIIFVKDEDILRTNFSLLKYYIDHQIAYALAPNFQDGVGLLPYNQGSLIFMKSTTLSNFCLKNNFTFQSFLELSMRISFVLTPKYFYVPARKVVHINFCQMYQIVKVISSFYSDVYITKEFPFCTVALLFCVYHQHFSYAVCLGCMRIIALYFYFNQFKHLKNELFFELCCFMQGLIFLRPSLHLSFEETSTRHTFQIYFGVFSLCFLMVVSWI